MAGFQQPLHRSEPLRFYSGFKTALRKSPELLSGFFSKNATPENAGKRM